MSFKYANMSMLEVAEHLMSRKKTPQSFKKIATEVSELLGMSAEELMTKIARFYADLTLSGKFVNVGGDKWDLKSRQKFETAELQFQYDDEATIEDFEEDDDDEDEDFDSDTVDADEFDEDTDI